ncbi:MAG: DNA primase, partial [Cyclobacteriaceae bacterium]|nr:DNA primase [Cyclobacteriaceae bacterium]
MLKTSTIQAVRDLAVADVIGRYIELKKKGANYLATSPFTDEKTPSFTVFPRNNNFKCFSSGKQGDGIAFAMEYNKLEFYEAILEIAQAHGIPIEEEDLTPKQKEKRQKEYDEFKEIRKVMEYAKSHYLTNPIPEEWMKNLKYKEDLLSKFQVGYGSGSTLLVDDAIKAGFSTDLLKKAGLLRNVLDMPTGQASKKVWVQVDAYADRVIFPILDTKGNTVAFTARYNGNDEKAPKYINSPSSVWEKGRYLYGLYQAQDSIRKANKVYLVEGPTDVIAMHRWGIDNTVCPCGTALTDDQCKLLRRYTDNVCIVPDNDLEKEDSPGMKALERNALLLLKHGLFVSVLIPGTDKQVTSTDPDSFLRKIIHTDNVKKWLDKEERYIEDYFVKVCMSKAALGAKEKGEAFSNMVAIIESIQDDVFRQAYYDSVCNDWPYFKKHKL